MGAGSPLAPPLAPARAPLTKEEIQMLDQQAKAVEAQLEATRKRLEALRQKPGTQGQWQPYYAYTVYGYPPIPYAPPSPEEELAFLGAYKKDLEDELKGIDA
ncbi:DUF5320 domain-containing protein [Candidatus Bathyarchaeota archaeon]|nr:DUF5320 domain-containing protein [Candidatus Bathyarchaeota archaeon]